MGVHQRLYARNSYGMAAQPGVYEIQFRHIPLNVFKRNIWLVEQFGLI
jgi:hypothetical protein